MSTDKTVHLHLVSDSTGETVSSIVRSVMSQFEHVDYETHTWALVRTQGQMERVLENIKKQGGVVLYTIIDTDLEKVLTNTCRKLTIPYIAVLSKVMKEMSRVLGVQAKARPGRQYQLDEEYFERMDAVNFTLAHDDGQLPEDLEEADIVLVGVSRTSKTPTCLYLSYRGLKVANVPYVQGCPLPENLEHLKNPVLVGLFTSPDRLIQIRKSRLLSLNENRDTSYVDIDVIKEETAEARRYFVKNGWPVIDVTRKSVEETSAKIMQFYTETVQKRNEKHDN